MPPYTLCARESGAWVCVSDSSRKRHMVDTQSLLVRHIVSGLSISVRVCAPAEPLGEMHRRMYRILA
jgi:hypothetical protein